MQTCFYNSTIPEILLLYLKFPVHELRRESNSLRKQILYNRLYLSIYLYLVKLLVWKRGQLTLRLGSGHRVSKKSRFPACFPFYPTGSGCLDLDSHVSKQEDRW